LWLVQPNRLNPQEIPQCIIYANTKVDCVYIAQKLQELLPPDYHRKPIGPFQLGSDVRTDAQRLIAVFYSTLDSTTKTMTHEDMMAGRTRVLVSSEAYGLGIDVDVVRVVQWGISKVDSMDTIVQRFGRAGRNFDKQAMCVLYVERSYLQAEEPSVEQDAPSQSQAVETQAETQTAAAPKGRRRNALQVMSSKDPSLVEFINTPAEIGCRRRVILKAYSDPLSEAPDEEVATGPCCDLDDDIDDHPCGLGWGLDSGVDHPARPTFPTCSADIKKQMRPKLEEFRRRIFKRDWEAFDDIGLCTEALVLTDKHITLLTKNCTRYPTVDDLKKLRGFSWVHIERYGPALCGFVQKVVNKLKTKETQQKRQEAEAKKNAQKKQKQQLLRMQQMLKEQQRRELQQQQQQEREQQQQQQLQLQQQQLQPHHQGPYLAPYPPYLAPYPPYIAPYPPYHAPYPPYQHQTPDGQVQQHVQPPGTQQNTAGTLNSPPPSLRWEPPRTPQTEHDTQAAGGRRRAGANGVQSPAPKRGRKH
jgi:superfamily II DNA/RNA helicase